MSTRIRIARGSRDLDSVFRVRHRVFSEEEGYFPPVPDGRVVDRFDAFPETAVVLAEVDGETVGTIRLTEYGEAGTSADPWYDFRPHFPPNCRAGAASLLAVRRAHRSVPGLTFAMMGMGYVWAHQRGLTHLTGAANPVVVPLFVGSGWKVVGPKGFSEAHGLPYVPILLELDQLNNQFAAFLKKQRAERLFAGFERGFYQAGEVLFRIGDAADSAFVVVDGELSVRREDGSEMTRLGPTDVFGEVALLIGRPRTATVVAITDVTVMVVDRPTFDASVRTQPEVAVDLMRNLAIRLAEKT